MKSNRHVFIIYDSVHNAVFESQVVQPIQKQLQQNPAQEWHIITFEKNPMPSYQIENIKIHVVKRYPYINRLSLWPLIRKTKTILLSFQEYNLIARGPFAGYIALNAATKHCRGITIQARGLAAQEYAFAHKHSFGYMHQLRTHLLERLEQCVFSTHRPMVIIEAVSPALRTYLIDRFHADPTKITLAHHDMPNLVPATERLLLRKQIRMALHIADDTVVYCYNGSYKPWQCPKETLLFFKHALAAHSNSFLLILTQNTQEFMHVAQAMHVPQHTYLVRSVDQHELYAYLAACDIGILFREPHVINSVSRPTKAIEYHAAGLQILHNGTVDYITQTAGIDHVLIPFADIAQ